MYVHLFNLQQLRTIYQLLQTICTNGHGKRDRGLVDSMTARGGHRGLVWYPVLTTSTAAGVLRPQYLNPPFLKNRYQIFIFEDSKPSQFSQKKTCLKISMAFPCNLHHFWPCGPDIQGLPRFCAPPHCPPAAAANWRAARWRWASEDTAKSSRPCLISRIFWVAAWLFHRYKYWD